MPSLLSILLGRFSWKSFALGAGTALFGGVVARPALAQVVKVGMDVQDYASATVAQAKAEYERARATAVAQRTGSAGLSSADILAEIQKLHAEITSLRSSISTKKA
jgi:hypothetical protein